MSESESRYEAVTFVFAYSLGYYQDEYPHLWAVPDSAIADKDRRLVWIPRDRDYSR